jgi:O-antigen ligase
MVMALAAVMVFSPRWRDKRPEILPPNALLLLTYLLLACSTLFVSDVPIYAGFGLSKIIRAMMVYWLAYNYLSTENDLRFFLLILAGIVAFEFLLVLQQRLTGVYRATGTLPHPNTLALYINMMNMIFLSFVLNDRAATWQKHIYRAALIMGSLIVLATFSRAGLVVMVTCYAVVILLSLVDRAHFGKIRIIFFMALLALPLAIKVTPSIIERFETAPVNAELSREQANEAAIAMAGSGWLGVGLNNYSHAINETRFSRFVPLKVDRGIVHNVFLLHAAETGWIGLFLFILLISSFLWMALRIIFKRLDNVVSWVAIGIFAAMLSLWIQSSLEWAFRQTYITVEYFMLAGFLAALPRVLRHMSAMKRKRRVSYRARLVGSAIARRRNDPVFGHGWIHLGTSTQLKP